MSGSTKASKAKKTPSAKPLAKTGPKSKTLQISAVNADESRQPRAQLDQDTISGYTDALENGAEFPAVEVFFDGSTYWLADGWHRIRAHIQAKKTDIKCRVHQGTERDATLFSFGANATHGLRRTNADKRRMVMKVLADPEWSKESNHWIANKCGVSQPFVGICKKEREPKEEPEKKTDNRYQSGQGGGGQESPPKNGDKPKTLEPSPTDEAPPSKPVASGEKWLCLNPDCKGFEHAMSITHCTNCKAARGSEQPEDKAAEPEGENDQKPVAEPDPTPDPYAGMTPQQRFKARIAARAVTRPELYAYFRDGARRFRERHSVADVLAAIDDVRVELESDDAKLADAKNAAE